MFDLAFYLYIIASKYHGTLYIGHTDDLGLRMRQHIDGVFNGFAKRYGCKHLVWFETFDTRDAAFKRERQMKAWKRRWKIELIETGNPHWIDIAQAPVWPLPDADMFPTLYDDCLACSVDPNFRWDERKVGTETNL